MKLVDWIDSRTGGRKLLHEALFENVPGGARWRYVWGSTLVFCFTIQVITGLFLWLAYSPSSQTAWESVYYIQHEMAGGWFLRGLHHYTAQAMTVLLVLHLMQVVIDGAYKAPREVNFWTGIGLFFLVLALSLTGYLLPWDQKGFWATKVATNIVAIVPLVGPGLQRLIIGGTDYGHQTLTRFFAVHAGFIPGAIIAFIAAHIWLFRRHGLTPKEPRRKPDAPFWPDQVMRDAVASLAVLAVVLFLAVRAHGAELGAPADPSEPFAAARPEWYFLFLFQFLKYFPGGSEFLGAILIPLLFVAILVVMPYLGRNRGGHRFNLAFLWLTLIGVAALTALARREDRASPSFLAAEVTADRDAARAVALAQAPTGIPVDGAAVLLRNDPLTQGPRLFARNCASCHRYGGTDGLGGIPKDPPKASDLKGYASREWLTGLLDPQKIDTAAYFGNTAHNDGDMPKFVKKDVAAFTPERKANLAKIIVALSAGADLPVQRDADKRDAAIVEEGKKLLLGGKAIGTGVIGCIECHEYQVANEDARGPVLTNYASREWLVAFISNPEAIYFYPEDNDHMPAFGEQKRLTPQQIGLIADWLRGDWYEPGDKQ